MDFPEDNPIKEVVLPVVQTPASKRMRSNGIKPILPGANLLDDIVASVSS